MKGRCAVALALSTAAAAVIAVAAAAQVQGDGAPPRPFAPFFHLRLENARVFTDTDYAPLLAGLVDLLAARLGLEGEASRERLLALQDRVRWPLAIDVALDPDTSLPVVGAWMPGAGAGLLAPLVDLAGGRGGEPRACTLDGSAFALRDVVLPGEAATLTLCEGQRGERSLLLLQNARADADAASALARFVRGCERRTPSSDALEAQARGGDFGFVLRPRILFAEFGEDLPLALAMSRIVLGSTFAGVAGRVRVADGRVADRRVDVDLFADVRAGRGWIGALAPPAPQPLDIAGWLPEGTTDWVALDVGVDFAVRQLAFGSGFGGIRAGELHPELGWLGDLDLRRVLDTHCTGQVLAATTVGIDEGALEGFALVFGAFDGLGLLEEVIAAAARAPETAVAETPELGPGVVTVDWHGEPFLHLAARRDALVVAKAGGAGAAMLRACLGAGGRSRALPGDRVATMIGRGHLLRHLLDALPEPAPGDASARLPALLGRFLEGRDRVASWRLVIDGDGARLHVEL